MMRAAEPPGNYKKFLGSSFLSDFTLIICSESAVEEQTAALFGCHNVSSSEPEPGTPDKALSPKAAAASATSLSSHGHAVATAPAAGASPAGEAAGTSSPAGGTSPRTDPSTEVSTNAGDAPCSGQDHHEDHADVVPHSPHCAAATAGLGPLSAAAMQRCGSQSQLQNMQASTHSAGDASTAQQGLKAIATSATVAAAGGGSRSNGLLAAAALTRASSSKALAKTTSLSSSTSSSHVIVMPVHGVVLAAASPYFETLLRGWACSQQPLHMVVGEDQLPAAQQLMSYIYTGSLQPNLPQSDLLQLLLLADRFDVARAVAAARRALASLSPECFEWTTLTGVWGLPQHLYEGDGDEAAALRGVAWERLLQLFGDLEEAWASADGRAMWQQLPWRAVSALGASDALAVASENTTFTAVSSWIAHQQHQQALLQQAVPTCASEPRPSPQELQLLAASIRLPAMGPCYLSYVCLQQDWFAAAVDIASLARAAAFAAAGPEVRKDLMDYTATSTAAAMQAAAAAAAASAPSRQGCCHTGSSAVGSTDALAPAAGGADCVGSTLGSFGLGGAALLSKCSSFGSSHHGSHTSLAAVAGAAASAVCGSSGVGCNGSSAIEHRMQLLSLAQSMQRPRTPSAKRAGQFSWRVDLAAIRQLYDDVAAAGSRDSRILRSPAHSFAGYEWALQLEVTQTRGATGFDVTKPWSLGVFLTCQVRLEQPANRQQQQQTLSLAPSMATVIGAGAAAGDAAAAAAGSQRLSGSGSSSTSGLPARGSSDGSNKDTAGGSSSPTPQQQQQQQQQQLVMQLVDFGFVSTSATIAVREAGSQNNKRMEKSWEHAVVRYRASWGWPNYLDAQAVGWDESLFGRWLIDGQLHLSARVRVLG